MKPGVIRRAFNYFLSLDFQDQALEDQYYEYQTQQDLRDSYRGLYVITAFFAIVSIVNLWIWSNILFI
jgi:hypothetical protein